VSPPARVRALGFATISLAVPRPGSYRLAVTYTPYWRSKTACLEQSADGMTRIVVRRPGVVRVHFGITPARALETIVGYSPEPCS
jgi:hypothetical protein